jgi:hypothetical protein
MKQCPPCHGDCDQGRRCPAQPSGKTVLLAIAVALLIFWHVAAFLVYWSVK